MVKLSCRLFFNYKGLGAALPDVARRPPEQRERGGEGHEQVFQTIDCQSLGPVQVLLLRPGQTPILWQW